MTQNTPPGLCTSYLTKKESDGAHPCVESVCRVLELSRYLDSPDGVAGVRSSLEEAACLGAGTQKVFCRQALGLGDVPDLVDEDRRGHVRMHHNKF
jgi:hypothetical protein